MSNVVLFIVLDYEIRVWRKGTPPEDYETIHPNQWIFAQAMFRQLKFTLTEVET